MTRFTVPYGKRHLEGEISGSRLVGIFKSGVGSYHPEAGEDELVSKAFPHPVASPLLEEIVAHCGRKTLFQPESSDP